MLSVARVPQEGLYGLGAVCMSAPHVSGTWSGRKCRAAPWDRGVRCPPQYHLLVKHSCARRRGSEHQRSRDQNSQGDSRGRAAAIQARPPGSHELSTEGDHLGPCSGGGATGSAGRKGEIPSSGPLGKDCVSEKGGACLGYREPPGSQGPGFLGHSLTFSAHKHFLRPFSPRLPVCLHPSPFFYAMPSLTSQPKPRTPLLKMLVPL